MCWSVSQDRSNFGLLQRLSGENYHNVESLVCCRNIVSQVMQSVNFFAQGGKQWNLNPNKMEFSVFSVCELHAFSVTINRIGADCPQQVAAVCTLCPNALSEF